MVSFNCDACGDVVKKPKLLQHYNRCYAPVTCLDCSMQFNSPNEFKSHNSCISEAEKYQKSVYKGPGGKKTQQQQQHNSNRNASPQKQQQPKGQPDTPKQQEQEQSKPAATVPSASESPSKKEKKEKRKREEAESAASEAAGDADAKAVEKDDESRDAKKAKKAQKADKKEKKEKKDKEEKKDKKSETARAEIKDDRFDLSKLDDASSSREQAASGSNEGKDDEDEDGGEDEDEDEHKQDDPMEEDKVIKPLNAEELEAFKKKQRKLGIIYISRIPPGMTPAKVRHILSNFGEVGRMYLKDGNQKPGEYGKSKKRSSAFYTEGWVEFLSKKVAKATAGMLNAQPIGALAASKSKNGGLLAGGVKAGKNTKRFQDEVWTMKYLKGFKWHMLSEQMAQERASLTARMRNELSQSAHEQNDYLRKVERAKVLKFKEEKKRKRAEEKGQAVVDEDGKKADKEAKGFKTFKQKKPVVKDVRDQKAEQA